MAGLVLEVLAGDFTVSRLSPGEPVPPWATAADFSSVTRTAEELSIICPSSQVPAVIKSERGWSLVKFCGPLDFGAVGVLAAVTAPLARAGISLLAIGTFDTDYVLIKSVRLDEAVRVLEAAGHTVRR